MALLDHPAPSNEPERNTGVSQAMGFCTWKTHKGPRELPADRFGTRTSGKLKNMCRLCDSARAAAYKKRMLSDPKTAAEFKRRQADYSAKWRERPGNMDKIRQYRRDWYERNKDGDVTKRSRENYVKRHPDRLRESQARYRQKVKADPLQHQRFLEARRIAYHLRLEQEGKTANRKYKIKMRNVRVLVDPQPLRTWIKPLVTAELVTPMKLETMTGIDEATCRIILYRSSTTIELHNVDKILTALNGPPLRSLYPDA